jgi:[citrate (pro-3S)-lyase] ligase
MSTVNVYREESLHFHNTYAVKKITHFLDSLGFQYEPADVDYTMVLYDTYDQIAGTGSYQGQVLKYVVVAPEHRKTNAASAIVTHLVNRLLQRHSQVFAFTRPGNRAIFEGLGFKKVATAEPLYTLLEFGYRSIRDYQDYLRSQEAPHTTTNIAAIVVNGNPFSNGHKYLIETAAAQSEVVYLFVVEEDRSVFPFNDRWKLINTGTQHLANVRILKGGPYVVSGATFPSYFLQNESVDQVIQNQTELDVIIFAKHIVPVLGITKRYVGTEPYSVTTRAYNAAMQKILPTHGVAVVEIERKTDGTDDAGQPNYISATKIRQAIKEDNLAAIMNFLPPCTRDYLLSAESEAVRARLKG